MNEKSDFCWIIEAPGQRYLSVQRLNLSDTFKWTQDHNAAIRFISREQADAVMMAVRELDRVHCAERLFAFETTLGNARSIEHGWLNDRAALKSSGGE